MRTPTDLLIETLGKFGDDEPESAIVIWMNPAGSVQFDEVGLTDSQECLLLEATKVQILKGER